MYGDYASINNKYQIATEEKGGKMRRTTRGRRTRLKGRK
jgi:hypothetical protein